MNPMGLLTNSTNTMFTHGATSFCCDFFMLVAHAVFKVQSVGIISMATVHHLDFYLTQFLMPRIRT